MKTITRWLMKKILKKTIKKFEKEENSIVKTAYSNLIKKYKVTIMYLEADLS